MLFDGAVVMLIGTGTVFSFLIIMVLMIYLMAYLVRNLSNSAAELAVGKKSPDNLDTEKVAVVIAAARAFGKGAQE